MTRAAVILGVVLATAGCKKDDKKQPAARPIDAAVAAPAPDAKPAAPEVPAVDPATLDKVLADRKVTDDDVIERGGNASSAWAVIASKTNDVDEVVEYTVLRQLVGGLTEVKLAAPKNSALAAVTSLEARDLDGDGADDAILAYTWSRVVQVTLPGNCETSCWVQTMEEVEELHLLGGKDALKDGFAHVIRYETSTTAAEDISEYADPEKVEYTWTVLPDSRPPMVSLTRTAFEIAKGRIDGLLDPAKFAAGEAKQIPAAF